MTYKPWCQLGALYAHVAIINIIIIIRERGSVLYLGMATEILNLPYFCITQIMAKEAIQSPNQACRENDTA